MAPFRKVNIKAVIAVKLMTARRFAIIEGSDIVDDSFFMLVMALG
jgi:hypothetical protein